MKETIDRWLKELHQIVAMAELNYEVWWVYNSKETLSKYINIMNSYPDFFLTSNHAHFVAYVVELYKLYEKGKDNKNIPGLLELLKEEKKMTNQDIKELENICQEARPLWEKINVLRSETFAHRSRKLGIKEVFRKARISPNEIKQLINLSKEIFGKIVEKSNRYISFFSLDVTADTEQLLKDLLELEVKCSKGNRE